MSVGDERPRIALDRATPKETVAVASSGLEGRVGIGQNAGEIVEGLSIWCFVPVGFV
jgi:hypothetical protein